MASSLGSTNRGGAHDAAVVDWWRTNITDGAASFNPWAAAAAPSQRGVALLLPSCRRRRLHPHCLSALPRHTG